VEERLEGIVHACRYDPSAEGKQFLGAAIESRDGRVWVIDYDEQSPFHAFAGRQVVVSGEPYTPEGQLLARWSGKQPGHFRVSALRLVDVTPDAELVEVGPGRFLNGRLERGTSDVTEPMLSFVTEKGDVFLVANEPAGAVVGQSVEVWAYPVHPATSVQTSPGQSLWIICPCSDADIWAWRGRRS